METCVKIFTFYVLNFDVGWKTNAQEGDIEKLMQSSIYYLIRPKEKGVLTMTKSNLYRKGVLPIVIS